MAHFTMIINDIPPPPPPPPPPDSNITDHPMAEKCICFTQVYSMMNGIQWLYQILTYKDEPRTDRVKKKL